MRTGILKSLTLLSLLFLAGCDALSGADAPPLDFSSTVRYEVLTSGCPANVTYSVGSSTQQNQVQNGWTYNFKISGVNEFLYVSAQNTCDSGSVQTNIYAHNYAETEFRLLYTAQSDGPYVIATASGSSGYN